MEELILGKGIHSSPIAEHVLAQVGARGTQHGEERLERKEIAQEHVLDVGLAQIPKIVHLRFLDKALVKANMFANY